MDLRNADEWCKQRRLTAKQQQMVPIDRWINCIQFLYSHTKLSLKANIPIHKNAKMMAWFHFEKMKILSIRIYGNRKFKAAKTSLKSRPENDFDIGYKYFRRDYS